VDLRTQTSLIAAILSVAIAAAVALRPRKRRVHWLFAVFGATVGAWYLTAFLAAVTGDVPTWARVNLTCGVLLPVTAVSFFRAFAAPELPRARNLLRLSAAAGAVLVLAILSPLYTHPLVNAAVFAFVLVAITGALALVYGRSRAATSRFERARLLYLAIFGALAGLFTILDYLPYVGLDIPPVGTVLTLVFLYALSQTVVRSRLLDLYELAGRLAVLTAVAFALAGIFWVVVLLASGRFFLHAVVASLVVLLLIEPLRTKVEERIAQLFFRERRVLEQAVADLRRRLAHVLEVDDVAGLVVGGLEQSRRATHVAVWLADHAARGFELAGHAGPAPAARLELGPAHPLVERLRRDDAVVLEALEREIEERVELGEAREAEVSREIAETLEKMQASVCVSIRGASGEIYGLLGVRDERLRDAFAPEEVQLLRGLGAQAAIAIENSRLYRRMKDRDRLAALGEMAAGLAHEIRNPLGAIKASAQYLAEDDAADHEFLGVIVEEVDRLNHVVSSFLDYARPSRGDAAPIDVNAAVRRTMQMLGAECETAGIDWTLALDEAVPPARIDAEQLRQVLINLVQNALQAMGAGRGRLVVGTASVERVEGGGRLRRSVELRVEDTGPGIPKTVLANLFVPFVTTKDRGTGLGLAICQRIVSAAGGEIEVRTREGEGTTFVVRLPASEPSVSAAGPGDAAAGAGVAVRAGQRPEGAALPGEPPAAGAGPDPEAAPASGEGRGARDVPPSGEGAPPVTSAPASAPGRPEGSTPASRRSGAGAMGLPGGEAPMGITRSR
jgi:signal transduction histidine kinase